MRTDVWTNMTKLLVAFGNFENTPKNMLPEDQLTVTQLVRTSIPFISPERLLPATGPFPEPETSN